MGSYVCDELFFLLLLSRSVIDIRQFYYYLSQCECGDFIILRVCWACVFISWNQIWESFGH